MTGCARHIEQRQTLQQVVEASEAETAEDTIKHNQTTTTIYQIVNDSILKVTETKIGIKTKKKRKQTNRQTETTKDSTSTDPVAWQLEKNRHQETKQTNRQDYKLKKQELKTDEWEIKRRILYAIAAICILIWIWGQHRKYE